MVAGLLPLLKLLWRAVPVSFGLAIVAQLVSGALMTLMLMLAPPALDQILAASAGNERWAALVPSVGALAAVFMIRIVMDAVMLIAKASLVPKINEVAERELFAAALSAPLAAFNQPQFYEQLHRARDRGVMHIEGSAAALIDLFAALCALVGAAVGLVLLHPVLLLVLVVALLPEGVFSLIAARNQYAGMSRTIALGRQAQLMGELATQRESAAELRANQAQPYVLSEFSDAAAALRRHLVKLGCHDASLVSAGRLLGGGGLVATFGALLWFMQLGWVDLAVAGTVIVALRGTASELSRSMQIATDLFEKSLYVSEYSRFVGSPTQPKGAQPASRAPPEPGSIEVQNLRFQYPGRTEPVLIDIDFRIDPGQVVALVGENGSGKSTLARLLAGLYEPSAGRVLWDGVDIASLDPSTRADRIAMVQQHAIRWPRSARANIRIGRHEYVDEGDERLHRVARLARADEVVDRLPAGWDTLLSSEYEGGCDLSSGQWQRLAIARGLYRDAPLVIWDEPAASLDARAEHAIYQALKALGRGRTVVLITHRLASVREADQILFLERGRLVEHGRHEELLAKGGRYAEMLSLQEQLSG